MLDVLADPPLGKHGMVAFKQECLDYAMRMFDKMGHIPSVHLCSTGRTDLENKVALTVLGIPEVYYYFGQHSTFNQVQHLARHHAQENNARFSCLTFMCWAYIQYEPDELGQTRTQGKVKNFVLDFSFQRTRGQNEALEQLAAIGIGTSLFRCCAMIYEELQGSMTFGTTTLLLFGMSDDEPGIKLRDSLEFSDTEETPFRTNDLGRRILSNTIYRRPSPPANPIADE